MSEDQKNWNAAVVMHVYSESHCLLPQDVEQETKLPLEQVSIEEILEMQREEQLMRQQEAEKKKKALQERGLAMHSDPIQDDFTW